MLLQVIISMSKSYSFSLNVHVYYDDTFNSRFGSQATTKVNALFAMVKTLYAHSSLTTVVEQNVIEITYRAGASWQAGLSTLEYVIHRIIFN